MKKILILLIFLYTFGFSAWKNSTYSNVIAQITQPNVYIVSFTSAFYADIKFNNSNGYQTINGKSYPSKAIMIQSGIYTYIENFYSSENADQKTCNLGNLILDDGIAQCTNGNYTYKQNPDPSGGSNCNDLFLKDGIAYTCNPNTNEATPIENADGLATDPVDGKEVPSCNEGYEWTSTPSLTIGGSGTETGYNVWGCSLSSSTGDGSTGDGSTGGDIEDESGIITTNNPDGSTTITMPNGTSQTIYPDGTSTTSGSTGGFSGGSGGSGSSAGTGATPGATTPSEDGTTGTDEPYNPESVSTSCSDSTLTLQEKMLCELNEGMKNQNSEGDPSNSLNNLLKDLNSDTNKSLEAINKNIKSSNDNQALINKNLVEANKNSSAMVAKQNASNVYLKNIDENLKEINDNLEGEGDGSEVGNPLSTVEADMTSLTGQWTTFYNNINGELKNVKTLYQNGTNIISNGFGFNVSTPTVATCAQNHSVSLAPVINKEFPIIVDFCKYTSTLRVYLYPFFFVIFTFFMTMFIFKSIRGL